jgi:hypothetical protein
MTAIVVAIGTIEIALLLFSAVASSRQPGDSRVDFGSGGTGTHNPQTSVRAPPSPCGLLQDRHRCILESIPIFTNESCVEWRGSVVSACAPSEALVPLSLAEAKALLNGRELFFIGDSTSRRSGEHLTDWLSGREFVEEGPQVKMERTVTDASTGFSMKWTQYWVATMTELFANINGQSPECGWSNSCEWFPGPSADATKLIVVALSTWDMFEWFRTPMDPEHIAVHVPKLVAQFSEALHALKRGAYFDAERDILLVRLPVPQSCSSGIGLGTCNATTGTDPINTIVKACHFLLKRVLLTEHPEVGLIDINFGDGSKTGWALGGRTAPGPTTPAPISTLTKHGSRTSIRFCMQRSCSAVISPPGKPRQNRHCRSLIGRVPQRTFINNAV